MASEITTKGVIVIDGKQVENTFNGLRRAVRNLESDLKKLEVGSDEYVATSEKLKEVKARFQEVNNEIRGTNKTLNETSKEFESVGGTFGSFKSKMLDMFSGVASGQISFKELGSTIKAVSAEAWVSISSIPLVGWLASVAAGIGLVVKQAMDYNKEIGPQLKLLGNLGLDKTLLPQLRALKESFGIEFDEIADMMDNLVDAGVVKDQAAALESIKIALAKAPNKGELISFLNNSADTARKTGLSLEQLINIKQKLENTSVNPEKVFGAMETYVSRVLSQSEKIQPVLQKSFGGEFAQKFYKDLESGAITYSQGLDRIYKKGEELKLSDKERADVAKAFFGKAGASATSYNDILSIIHESYEKLDADLSESQKKTLELADAYEDLEIKKDAAFNSATLRSFMFDLKKFWIQAKTVFFEFISGTVDGWKLFGYNITATLSSVPKIFSALGRGIMKDIYALGDAASALGSVLGNALTGNFDAAGKSWDRLKSVVSAGFNGDAYKEFKSFFGAQGSINQNSLAKIKAANAANAAAADLIEQRQTQRETPDSPDGKKNNKDKNGKSNKKTDPKKAADDEKKRQEEIAKAEAEAYKNRMQVLFEFEEKKAQAIEDEFQRESQLEAVRRNKEAFENQQKIAELEKKKLTASLSAKANIQKEIDTLNQIEEINEDTHRKKLLKIQTDADAKLFEETVKAEQQKIERDRRLAEDKINDISTMEEAELALSQMKSLKLTEQELAGIKNLEDAKRALREDADRAMLKAQLESLDAQKKQLEKALEGLTGEAAEKLKKDLDELNSKITHVKGVINGGNEADDKKVQEENRQKRSSVDLLGYSVQDWEDMWNNLKTTEGKIQGVIMVTKALGNAASMYSKLVETLGQKEIKKFEKNQDKKKKELLKQLNQGYINQEEYHKGIELLEAQTANKKAEIAYKTAKAQKAADIMSAVSGTASAVVGALGNKPWTPANFVLAGLVGALGAVQIGMIAAQPLPEKPSFAVGGYTGSGYGSPDASGYRPAGTVHENEYVTPEWMLQNPVVADTVAWMESIRTGRIPPPKGYADGGFVENQDTENQNQTAAPPAPVGTMEFMALFSDLKELLQYLKDNGIDAYMVADAENGKQIKVAIKEFENIENRNKRK